MTTRLRPWKPFATPDRFGPGEAITCGVVWGLAIAAFECLVEPARDLESIEFLAFALQVSFAYTVAGILLAVLGLMIDERLRGAGKLAATALTIIIAAALHITLIRLSWWIMPGVGINAMLSFVPDLIQQATHVLWIFGFFGSAYLSGFVLFRRSSQLRQRIRRAELARTEAEVMIDRARIEDIAGLLQPALLLASVAELESRYAVDADHADVLLDRLVGYLRAAMPKLRSRTSDLHEELALVEHYAELCRELGRGRCAIAIEYRDRLPRQAFPPLILIPLVEHLAQRVPDGTTVALRMRAAGGAMELVLAASEVADPGWLPEELAQRLQIATRAVGCEARIAATDRYDNASGWVEAVVIAWPIRTEITCAAN